MLVGPLLPVGLVERDGAKEGKYVEITGTEGKKKNRNEIQSVLLLWENGGSGGSSY